MSPGPADSHAGSPSLDEEGNVDVESCHSSPEAPASKPVNKKRKSLADTASDIAGHERINRRRITEDLAKEKTRRSTAREHIKREAHFNIEMARMEHATNDANARRAHELVMMDRTMELERLRAGNHAAGPNYEAPNHMLDPGMWSNR